MQQAGSHVHYRWDIKWFATLENSLDDSHEAKHWGKTQQWHWRSHQNIQVGWVYNKGGGGSILKSHMLCNSTYATCQGVGNCRNEKISCHQEPGTSGFRQYRKRKMGMVIKGQGKKMWTAWDALNLNGQQQTYKPICMVKSCRLNACKYTHTHRKIQRQSSSKRNIWINISDLLIYDCYFLVML